MPVITPAKRKLDYSLGIVVSRFNHDITQKLVDGAVERLKSLGLRDDQIDIAWVPGAVEIPIAAKRLAATKKYAAVLCFGAVIYGETRHFDYVCDQVSQGCQTVALTEDLPVIFGVLTTNNHAQAVARSGGEKGHIGVEYADTAVEMVNLLHHIG